MAHALIDKYGDPLALLDRVPRTAGELYRRWSAMPSEVSLSRRRRNERRWLAKYLTSLSYEGTVVRRVITEEGHTWVAFWREAVGAHDPARGQPACQPHLPDDRRRADGRGVGQ